MCFVCVICEAETGPRAATIYLKYFCPVSFTFLLSSMMTNKFQLFPTISISSLGLATFGAWTRDKQRKLMEGKPKERQERCGMAASSKARKMKYSCKMMTAPAFISKQLHCNSIDMLRIREMLYWMVCREEITVIKSCGQKVWGCS